MKNLKADLQEKALDDILHYAAKEAGEQINKEFDGMNEIEFSKEHTERMEKLFKNYRRREKLSEFKKRAGQIVAVFVLVAVLTTGISVFSVQAWRIKFLNFITNITESNTEIKLEENVPESRSYSSEMFDINYIPEGFNLNNDSSTDNTVYLEFNDSKSDFSLQINKNDTFYTNFDSEDAKVKKVKFNNISGYLTSENNNNFLIWNINDLTFILVGNIDESELIKIAENIVIKK